MKEPTNGLGGWRRLAAMLAACLLLLALGACGKSADSGDDDSGITVLPDGNRVPTAQPESMDPEGGDAPTIVTPVTPGGDAGPDATLPGVTHPTAVGYVEVSDCPNCLFPGT